jgi:uncharacterized membrane protein
MEVKSKRYTCLDFIRGVAVINMIVFHILWNLVNIYKLPCAWFSGNVGRFWERCICFTFIFVSGFCYRLGRHHLKSGLKVFAGGLAVTAVTCMVMPDNRIIFGILTCLGSFMLLLTPLDDRLKQINQKLGLALCVVLFVLFYGVGKGYIGMWSFSVKLPDFLYNSLVGTYLGFKQSSFKSGDYFPILPWLFLFLSGYFSFGVISKKSESRAVRLPSLYVAPINIVGQYALLVYLLHQPIIYGAMELIF